MLEVVGLQAEKIAHKCLFQEHNTTSVKVELSGCGSRSPFYLLVRD